MGPLLAHGCHSQVFTWTDEEALKIDSKLMERRMAEFVHAFIETLQAGVCGPMDAIGWAHGTDFLG